MTPNPFDQGARYVAKLDPPSFLRWLIPGLDSSVTFHGWLDTRSVPFPSAGDRTCDTVAAVSDSTNTARWWALPVEFQPRPDAQLFGLLWSCWDDCRGNC